MATSFHALCCHPVVCLVAGLNPSLFIIEEKQFTPPCRNANLPKDFGQESSSPANKLNSVSGVNQEHPATSNHFTEKTIKSKPQEREDSQS